MRYIIIILYVCILLCVLHVHKYIIAYRTDVYLSSCKLWKYSLVLISIRTTAPVSVSHIKKPDLWFHNMNVIITCLNFKESIINDSNISALT